MYSRGFHRDDDLLGLAIIVGIVIAVLYHLRKKGPYSDAYGSASWASDKLLRAWGMLDKPGLVIGRTLSGSLIRLPRYCHILVTGSTGSGKGVGIIIPALAVYFTGSVVAFDPKNELRTTVSEFRRRRGNRIISLDPFGDGGDTLNPLDCIPAESPDLIDAARALVASLVVPEPSSKEPHWDAKAAQICLAVLVLVLIRFPAEERSLNSLQSIVCDIELMWEAIARLKEIGGLPERFGGQIRGLFEKPKVYTREGSSVVSMLQRHLAWLDSPRTALSVASSTFDVNSIRSPGVTVFLRIPEEHLESSKGLLRLWTGTFVRSMATSKTGHEALLLFDEASALGGLPAIAEALVRGRSAGIRLLLAYQSDSQVRAAFPNTPTLIHDNTDTQLYLGINGLEQAERLVKMLGSFTGVIDSSGSNASQSRSLDGQNGGSVTRGTSKTQSFHERALLRIEELLRLGDEYLVAFHRGLPDPVLGLRVKWYEDPAFNPGYAKPRPRWGMPLKWRIWFGLLAVAFFVLVVRAKVNKKGYWQPEPKGGVKWQAR